MSANAVRGVLVALRAESDDPSDADLIRRFARARDGAAFAELVRRYGPLVLGVGRRAVPGYDPAEDPVQAAVGVLTANGTGPDLAASLVPAPRRGVAPLAV